MPFFVALLCCREFPTRGAHGLSFQLKKRKLKAFTTLYHELETRGSVQKPTYISFIYRNFSAVYRKFGTLRQML